MRAQGHNGLDYLEVSGDQRILTVFFLLKGPAELTRNQVRIEGGRRIRGIRVLDVRMCRLDDPTRDDCMQVRLDRPGDFSTYRLRLVRSDDDPRPPAGIDSRYAELTFSFKVDCPSELDCLPASEATPEPRPAPELTYLAKDYASFRQLLFDRLAVTMPHWREQHVPDLGVTLVELLAYAGDQLSYHQDAVATEAYLDTARQRISVRRHARLVDYRMHEGCNARAWVAVGTDQDLTLPADVTFATAPVDHGRPEVFVPVEPVERELARGNSRIRIHTWGDAACCLERGTTAVTLVDQEEGPGRAGARRVLHLAAGDVLILEEVRGPRTGLAQDADPRRRHPVLITDVHPDDDPLDGTLLLHVEWAVADALPFPLCLSSVGPPPECAELVDVSVARGNVVLVDHGHWLRDESLGTVSVREEVTPCADAACGRAATLVPGRFAPTLTGSPLTSRAPLPPATSAATLAAPQDPRAALPVLEVHETGRPPWAPVADLLGSAATDRHVVVEVDNEGRAHLRFGDGRLGLQPPARARFTADYRIGNGPAGNVGADTIVRIAFGATAVHGVAWDIRNPLPATGGIAPETMASVKLRAPTAFRRELVRAVTADDYARLAERRPGVQRAAAALRFTGSVTVVRVAIDALGGVATDALLSDVADALEPVRRLGHDVVVVPATFVPLDVVVTVCVRPEYLPGPVRTAVETVLSGRGAGFFAPDRFAFGDAVRVSPMVAAVMALPGVENVEVTSLRRMGGGDDATPDGVLVLGPLEVARLDQDPDAPENGRLTLHVRGGRA